MTQKNGSHFGIFDLAQTEFVQTSAVSLAYQSYGKKSPTTQTVLLIVGHGGQLHYWSEGFINQLVEAGFHVLAFDNRDAGLSDKLDDSGVPNMMDLWYRWNSRKSVQAPYTLEDMATDTIELLDQLNIKEVHIIGASMGGMIAQITAALYPDRVRSVTSIMSTSGARHLPDRTPPSST